MEAAVELSEADDVSTPTIPGSPSDLFRCSFYELDLLGSACMRRQRSDPRDEENKHRWCASGECEQGCRVWHALEGEERPAAIAVRMDDVELGRGRCACGKKLNHGNSAGACSVCVSGGHKRRRIAEERAAQRPIDFVEPAAAVKQADRRRVCSKCRRVQLAESNAGDLCSSCKPPEPVSPAAPPPPRVAYVQPAPVASSEPITREVAGHREPRRCACGRILDPGERECPVCIAKRSPRPTTTTFRPAAAAGAPPTGSPPPPGQARGLADASPGAPLVAPAPPPAPPRAEPTPEPEVEETQTCPGCDAKLRSHNKRGACTRCIARGVVKKNADGVYVPAEELKDEPRKPAAAAKPKPKAPATRQAEQRDLVQVDQYPPVESLSSDYLAKAVEEFKRRAAHMYQLAKSIGFDPANAGDSEAA